MCIVVKEGTLAQAKPEKTASACAPHHFCTRQPPIVFHNTQPAHSQVPTPFSLRKKFPPLRPAEHSNSHQRTPPRPSESHRPEFPAKQLEVEQLAAGKLLLEPVLALLVPRNSRSGPTKSHHAWLGTDGGKGGNRTAKIITATKLIGGGCLNKESGLPRRHTPSVAP